MSGPRRLRAYALTGGRTRAVTELAMETLLVASGRPPPPELGPEARAILQRCASPQSLVDLSATLDMPLGVIRVLLSDLLSHGLIQRNTSDSDGEDAVPLHRDLTLLGELLDGIEAL